MMLRSAPTDVQLFAAAQRLFMRDTTPQERSHVRKAAQKIQREQRAGREFTLQEFCARLLADGLKVPHDQAAAIVDAALSSDAVPPELRQAMN